MRRCSATGWCARLRKSSARSIRRACSTPARSCTRRRMDERRLFRYPPDYRAAPVETALDWSPWGGFLGAAEMCNNNGACRKAEPGVMCPSYRVTDGRAARHPRPGQHASPGPVRPARARCADQRGDGGDAGSVRGVQGVPARMPHRGRHGTHEDRGDAPDAPAWTAAAAGSRDRLSAALCAAGKPRPLADAPARPRARAPPRCPSGRSGSARGARCRAGIPGRIAPRPNGSRPPGDGRDVVLFADTFTTWFEPDNARAAVAVLEAAGYRVHAAAAARAAAALLRADLSRGRAGRGGQARGAGDARGAQPVRRGRRAGGRA